MRDTDFVERLIAVVARSPIEELEIEKDGWRVRIARAAQPRQAASAPSPDLAATAPVPAAAVHAGAATPRRHPVRAPLTGVFYRSVAEGEVPLVAVGDVVEEGRQLAVLEAMKTFNPVEADRAGRIVEIGAGDRDPVQAGDVLFVLEDLD